MSEVIIIPLSRLHFHEHQEEKRPRHVEMLRDPESREKLREIDPQVVGVYESFAEKGQLDPCVVLPKGKDHYMWCGNQRLAAALALGWESLDCVVVQSWDQVPGAVTKHYKSGLYWHPELNKFHTSSYAFSAIEVSKLHYNSEEGERMWGGLEEPLTDQEWRHANEDKEIVWVYRSLRDQGQLNPVILREGNKVAIGMERLACARALGWESLLCYKWPPSVADVRDVMASIYDRRFVWNGKELVEE